MFANPNQRITFDSTNANNRQMILHSNHPYFQPAEHVFFRNYEPCDFCRVSVEEDQLSKVGGYCLCEDCKAQYEQDQKDNAILSEANLINIKYSGEVSAPF